MIVGVTLDFRNVVVIAAVALVVVVLAYRLLNRDPRIRKTRIGWFIERDRFEDEISPHRGLPSSLEDDLEDTKEIPPPGA